MQICRPGVTTSTERACQVETSSAPEPEADEVESRRDGRSENSRDRPGGTDAVPTEVNAS